MYLKIHEIRAIVDDRNEKIGRKIRDNEMKRIPYMLIVGEKEAENGESIISFLEMLRQRLSEYCDKDVKVVRDAKKAITLCHKSVYPEYF